MPYQEQTEKNAAYVDVRFYLDKTTEVFTDIDGDSEVWTTHDIGKVERKKIKGITEDDLEALGESFGQVDDYHLFFQNDLPYVISDGVKARFRR